MHLYELLGNVSSFLMALLYLFLLLQVGSSMGFVRRKRKNQFFLTIPVFLFTLVVLLIFLYTEENGQTDRSVVLTGFWNWAGRLPASGITFLILLIGIYTVFLLLRIKNIYRTTINSNSIKESIDNLPTGLGFATVDGLVLLANQCMERLCYELTGSDFQDASIFWKKVTEGNLQRGVQRIYGLYHFRQPGMGSGKKTAGLQWRGNISVYGNGYKHAVSDVCKTEKE